jgi:hypothetical protein
VAPPLWSDLPGRFSVSPRRPGDLGRSPHKRRHGVPGRRSRGDRLLRRGTGATGGASRRKVEVGCDEQRESRGQAEGILQQNWHKTQSGDASQFCAAQSPPYPFGLDFAGCARRAGVGRNGKTRRARYSDRNHAPDKNGLRGWPASRYYWGRWRSVCLTVERDARQAMSDKPAGRRSMYSNRRLHDACSSACARGASNRP